MVALSLLFVVPVAMAEQRELLIAMAIPPALAAGLIGRLLFELMGSGTGALRVAVAAPLAVLAAVAFAALAFAVLGARVEPWWFLSTGAGMTALLYGASRLRARELDRADDHQRVWYIGDAAGATALTAECAMHGELRLVGCSLVGDNTANPHRLAAHIVDARPTTLVLSARALAQPRFVELATQLNLRGIRVRSLLAFVEEEAGKVLLDELAPDWFLFDVAEIHRAELYGGAKRAAEVALSAFILALSTPLLVLIGAIVKLTSPGPVLFRQERVGLGGQRFVLTKLRTMAWRPEDTQAHWATTRTAHITPLGRMIRRFRIDELPQLWHVVRGHLSLVGPRPEQPAIVAYLEREIPYYQVRHCVRPGLTGWAQVNYRYGGSVGEAAGKLQYELYYIKNQSLRLDARIIAATVRTILSGSGR